MSLHPPIWLDRHQAGLALSETFSTWRERGSDTILLALPRGGMPVVNRSVAGELEPLVEQLVALALIDDLMAMGLWYQHFEQLEDEQVLELLHQPPLGRDEARASRSRSEGLR